MTNRLFIALEVPENIRDEIIKLRDSLYGDSSNTRWEKIDKLHITLKFLGDVDEKQNAYICDAVEKSVKGFLKFNLTFDRFGLFERNKIPAVFWIGLKNNPVILQLYENIEENLSRLGFPKEKRKFKAHLTLLRIKGGEDIISLKKMAETGINTIEFKAEKISLFKSQLNRSGSVYTTIKSFYLS